MACQTQGSAHISQPCTYQEYAQTAGFTVIETEETIHPYADASGSPNGYYTAACLCCHRLIWWQDSPGDCGQGSNVDLGFGAHGEQAASIASGVASPFIAAGSGIAVGVGAIAGIGALALLPVAIIGANHAKALAQERSVLCGVAVAFNEWQEAMEAAIRAGQIDLTAAITNCDQAQAKLIAAAKPVAKTAGDSAAIIIKTIPALMSLNKTKVFPALVPAPTVADRVGGLLTSLAGGNTNTQTQNVLSSTFSGAVSSATKFLIPILGVLTILLIKGCV